MRSLPVLLTGCLLLAATAVARAEAEVLRVGFFPNLTHAPALAARQLEREGQDCHQAALPAGVKLEWRSFNAGPSAMEALLAGAIDLAYVGASPALNAHVRTQGEEIRVLAPVAQGGNALVVRAGADLHVPQDFRGRRIGTPQLGNTQDIDARTWLRQGGLKVHLGGGDAHVVPAQNADLMLLFSRGEVDAVWTVEPWVTRLTTEFGGVVIHENKDALITVLVTSRSALARRRPAIEAFVRSHYALCARLAADRAWQERLVRLGLGAGFHQDRFRFGPATLTKEPAGRFRGKKASDCKRKSRNQGDPKNTSPGKVFKIKKSLRILQLFNRFHTETKKPSDQRRREDTERN